MVEPDDQDQAIIDQIDLKTNDRRWSISGWECGEWIKESVKRKIPRYVEWRLSQFLDGKSAIGMALYLDQWNLIFGLGRGWSDFKPIGSIRDLPVQKWHLFEKEMDGVMDGVKGRSLILHLIRQAVEEENLAICLVERGQGEGFEIRRGRHLMRSSRQYGSPSCPG
jgi:hypothetical protein